jgi:hypothetical protein
MAGDIRFLTHALGNGVEQLSTPSTAAGQPTYYRTWGIPTGAGWRITAGKWNRIKTILFPKLKPALALVLMFILTG